MARKRSSTPVRNSGWVRMYRSFRRTPSRTRSPHSAGSHPVRGVRPLLQLPFELEVPAVAAVDARPRPAALPDVRLYDSGAEGRDADVVCSELTPDSL